MQTSIFGIFGIDLSLVFTFMVPSFARRVPFYYEVKVVFVIWLLSPYTQGSSVLYRKFIHPTLAKRENEIDDMISKVMISHDVISSQRL